MTFSDNSPAVLRQSTLLFGAVCIQKVSAAQICATETFGGRISEAKEALLLPKSVFCFISSHF